jgi:chromosome segregation ATPase
METGTITQIKGVKDQISINLESYKSYVKNQKIDLNTGQYGSENEYCINGIIAGVKNIMTDISFLVRSHDLFIKISTYTERQEINNLLSNLNSYLSTNQHANIATMLDSMKMKLRSYNLRIDRDRYLDFNKEIDNLRRKAIQLEEDIKITKASIAESSSNLTESETVKKQYDETFESLNQMKNDLVEEVTEFTNSFQSFKALSDKAINNEKIIETKLESIKEYENPERNWYLEENNKRKRNGYYF